MPSTFNRLSNAVFDLKNLIGQQRYPRCHDSGGKGADRRPCYQARFHRPGPAQGDNATPDVRGLTQHHQQNSITFDRRRPIDRARYNACEASDRRSLSVARFAFRDEWGLRPPSRGIGSASVARQPSALVRCAPEGRHAGRVSKKQRGIIGPPIALPPFSHRCDKCPRGGEPGRSAIGNTEYQRRWLVARCRQRHLCIVD